MSQETAPTQPAAPARSASVEKQALLEAYDTVLKHQAERREEEAREAEARRAARHRTRPFVWTSAALTLVLCSYLFIERPEWMFPQAGPVESTELQDASIRIGMANAAQHVQRFRQQNNRYPETLTEAGAYGATMASSYNSRGFVAEVMVDGDQFAVVADRIAPEAIAASERVPDWLA